MDLALIKSQRNQIFLAIKAAGVRTDEFEWSLVRSKWAAPGKVSRRTHQPTGFYFVFDSYVRKLNPRQFPASSFEAKESDVSHVNTWEQVVEVFKEWLKLVVEEHLEPDLWDSAETAKALMPQSIEQIENTVFSADEVSRITRSINELQAHLVATGHLNAAQKSFITARLQHLNESASRLGRKDWITLAIGTLTNIVVGVALAPEAAKDVLRTAGSLLGWVLGNVAVLP